MYVVQITKYFAYDSYMDISEINLFLSTANIFLAMHVLILRIKFRSTMKREAYTSVQNSVVKLK